MSRVSDLDRLWLKVKLGLNDDVSDLTSVGVPLHVGVALMLSCMKDVALVVAGKLILCVGDTIMLGVNLDIDMLILCERENVGEKRVLCEFVPVREVLRVAICTVGVGLSIVDAVDVLETGLLGDSVVHVTLALPVAAAVSDAVAEKEGERLDVAVVDRLWLSVDIVILARALALLRFSVPVVRDKVTVGEPVLVLLLVPVPLVRDGVTVTVGDLVFVAALCVFVALDEPVGGGVGVWVSVRGIDLVIEVEAVSGVVLLAVKRVPLQVRCSVRVANPVRHSLGAANRLLIALLMINTAIKHGRFFMTVFCCTLRIIYNLLWPTLPAASNKRWLQWYWHTCFRLCCRKRLRNTAAI